MQDSLSPLRSSRRSVSANNSKSNQRRLSHLKHGSTGKNKDCNLNVKKTKKCKTRLFDDANEKLKPEELYSIVNDVSSCTLSPFKTSTKGRILKKSMKTSCGDCCSDIEKQSPSNTGPRKTLSPEKKTLVKKQLSSLLPENKLLNTGSSPEKKSSKEASTPQKRSSNEVSSSSCSLKLAMSRLHVSSVPKRLPCRESEFDNIYRFVKSRLCDGVGGCMYISGVPGTGKTATVRSVMQELQLEANQNKLCKFKFIEINGLQLTEPRQAYVRILKELSGEKVTSQYAQEILERKFTKHGKKDLPTVLLVDELDMLCTRRQDVIYNMLEWPTVSGCRLIVITIANTMDLPEKLLMGRVTSRLGLTRLTFQPYTYRQLEEIVKARLFGVNAFDADAVQFVARKVASVSGDARRALNICRRATEIADADILQDGSVNSPRKSSSIVTMKHIDKALLEMFSSPIVQIIKNLSVMEQLLLKAVAAVVQDTGVEKCSFMKIYDYFRTLSTFDGITVPSSTKTLQIVARLGCYGLLLTEHSSADIYQTVMLNVNADDLHFALQTDSPQE